MFICIDCRVDHNLENDFLTLNLWGKPLFYYVVDEALMLPAAENIYVLTDSDKIKHLCALQYADRIKCITNLPQKETIFLISGRAPLLKKETLEKVLSLYHSGSTYSIKKSFGISFQNIQAVNSFLINKNPENVNAFLITDGTHELQTPYELNDQEAVVVNTKNDFELAIILKKKELNRPILQKAIQDRIKEKNEILRNISNENGICMVGHSQIDNWEISTLNNRKIRNCGIRGISSFEYSDYILKHNALECVEDTYILMHGTNDIVYENTLEEMCENIKKTITYIREKKANAYIYFVECIHVNGRLDRNNRLIDALNEYLMQHLENVHWISTKELDDEFGNLKAEYTKDGLHLSEEGYEMLQKIVEREVVS